MFNDITLFTCNYNNSYMTMKMIESFITKAQHYIPIIIMDNSDKTKINVVCKELFTVIDNTNFALTPDFNQSSINHCCSIDYAFKHFINTKYVLLCDTDILFNYEIINFLNLRYDYDLIGTTKTSEIIKPGRIDPCCCIINLERFNKEKLSYFDKNRCIVPNIPGLIKYDTGASFYEDAKNNNWKILNIDNTDMYFSHFGAGSKKSKDEYIKFLESHGMGI